MSTISQTRTISTFDFSSEKIWVECIGLLRSYARRFVYSAKVPCWHYQEQDIVEDIVQETIRRFIERCQRAECGKLPPIRSPKHVIVRIARNYCIDIWRRDCRLHHISDHEWLLEFSCAANEQTDLLGVASENVYREELFTLLAYEVAQFPAKQRRALLIDLANRMDFDTELTPLQKAFEAEGMDLRMYQCPLPTNPAERARHIALTSLAYKRIANCMHKYISEAA